jgi:predicted amidohydrolase YtcJ
VESPNPFHGLAVAVSREDPSGQPPGGWQPEQKLTLDQALAGFTSAAAFASFAEDRLGTLDRGSYADFIFVDRDIFAIAPQQIRDTQVVETYVAGRKVWSRR